MRNKMGNNKKGFTIIEVVLVLAVAALIFLIVFLAVPALNRSRRDTARKNDIGRAMAQLENYASNHNGNYPSNAQFSGFKDDFLGGDAKFADPSKGTYSVSASAPGTGLGRLQYKVNGKCNPATNAIVTGSGTRSIAMAIKLEQGGLYCQDNN